MAIGRPIELTPNIATKNISSIATADQTQFTVTGGYRINEIAVYRNGVRLADGRDFTASDGDTVNLVTGATVDDVIEFAVFDSFNIAGTIVSAASSQNLNGDLNVTGNLYAGTFNPTQLIAGIATVNTAFHVGSALTANAAGDVETIGIITAATFKGDGSGLTGIGETVNVRTNTITVSGVSTFTGAVDSNATTDSTSSTTGAITAAGGVGIAKDLFVGDAIDVTKDLKVGAAATITGALSAGAISGSTGTFSGAVNIDDTTDSTSATSGSLIVDGGLGVAKNVYIGAGLSVAGTLTYEDVTSVDSVGLITAKSGVNITGGEVTVGSGITMGIAGVATFSGTSDIHLRDNVKLLIGDGSSNDGDLRLWHDGTHSWIYNYNGQLTLGAKQGEDAVKIYPDEQVELYWNAAKKLETTNDGVVVTGISTATGVDVTSNLTVGSGITMGSAGVATFSGTADVHLLDNVRLNVGDSSDLTIYHDGSTSNMVNTSGTLNVGVNNFVLKRQGLDETMLYAQANSSVWLYYNDAVKVNTTYEGIEVTGFTSTTAGMGVTGGLFEGSFIKAGKLSDNTTLGISTANFFYFTTQETTTATPNIVWNDSYSLSSKMAVGDVASVTVVTTAAAGGYSANWTIDGNAVTEEWVGGSAPSAGGADGLDIYSLTIIKTGTGTGDSGFKVIANVSNAT